MTDAVPTDGDVPAAEPPYASVPRRALGRMIDTVVVLVVLLAVQALLSDTVSVVEDGRTVERLSTPGWVRPVLLGATLAYEFVLLRTRGRTIGKLLTGTVVVPDGAPAGTRLTVRSAVVRTLLTMGLLSLSVLGLIAALVIQLAAMLDPRVRGLHDKAARTVVLRV